MSAFIIQTQAGYTCCAVGCDGGPGCCDGCGDQTTCSYDNTMCAPGTRRCSADKPRSVPCGPSCTPNWSCGGCQCPQGTRTCSDGCGSSRTESCSCCTKSPPSPVALNYPANGATDMDNDITLTWNHTSSWGQGCPTTQAYTLYFRSKGSTCSGGTYSAIGKGTSTNHTLNNLNWNTAYCWYVATSNGAYTVNSAIREFTTALTPVHLGTQVLAPNCSSGISGNASISGTDNPISIVSTYRLNSGVQGIAQLAMAFIPSSVQNADNISEQTALSASSQYFMGIVSINHSNPSASQFYIVNNSQYTGPYTSGNATTNAGRATLMEINQGTRVEILNNTTVRITWKVRFEDSYPYIPVNNIYSGAFHLSPDGDWSNGFWNSNPNIIGLDRALTKATTWGVNTEPPNATITGPEATSATDFSITWAVTGRNLTQAQGYMWTTNTDLPITKLSPTPTTNYNLSTAEPANFGGSNIGVGVTTLGTHVYRINSDVDPTEIINTKMAANDTACNRVVVRGTGLPLSKSWFLTARGDVFATNINVNILDVELNPPLPSLNRSYSYLSTYVAGVQEEHLSTSTRQSKNSFILEAYDDLNGNPPISTGYTDWYSYIYDLVIKNIGETAVKALPAITVNEGSQLNTVFAANPYVKQHVKINGNLTIRQNVKCNLQSIIFVEGNLSLAPHFAIEESGTPNPMGCMFVVKGDINISTGIDANVNPINYPTSQVLGLATPEVKAAKKSACGAACASDNDCIAYGTGGDRVQCIKGVCSNVLCPGKEEKGTICNCLGVATCGEYCGYGAAGLCGDGISSCRYLDSKCPEGTLKTVCYPVARETPGSSFYDPAFDAEWSTPNCTVRDTGNAFIRNNYTNKASFTKSAIEALCRWCGNYSLDPGEECDPPGTIVDGQTCGSNCKLIPLATCGDGIKNQASEQCDYAEVISSCSTNYTCDTNCQCIYSPPSPITGPVNYDFIQAFLISNQTYTTTVDDRGNPNNGKYDGLYVRGSVIANSASLGRDLRLFNNAKQPAELIEFDSRYSQIFKEDLSRYSYSIREKGYINKLQAK